MGVFCFGFFFFFSPNLFKSFNAGSDKTCFCSGGRVSSGRGGADEITRAWLDCAVSTHHSNFVSARANRVLLLQHSNSVLTGSAPCSATRSRRA